VHFSGLIEEMARKHKQFQENIDCVDASIFISIPGLLVLRALEEDDHGLCKYFFAPM